MFHLVRPLEISLLIDARSLVVHYLQLLANQQSTGKGETHAKIFVPVSFTFSTNVCVSFLRRGFLRDRRVIIRVETKRLRGWHEEISLSMIMARLTWSPILARSHLQLNVQNRQLLSVTYKNVKITIITM